MRKFFEFRSLCLAFILLGCAMRFASAFLAPPHFVFSDSQDYHQIALNLLEGKGLSLSPELIAIRPPLYPIFLAGCYKIGLGLTGVRLLQALLGCLIVFLQYHFVSLVSRRKEVALVSAGLVALDPFLILTGALVLTECLFVALFLLALCLLCRSESGVAAFVSGIAMGLGILCRDALLGFVPFLMPVLFCLEEKGRFKRMVLLAMGAFCVVFPWTLRNYFHFGKLVPVTTKTGLNLYEALGPGATGAIRSTEMRLPPEAEPLPLLEKDSFLTRWTLKYAFEHPGDTLWLAFVKMGRFWNPGLNDAQLKSHKAAHVVFIFFNALVYLFAMWGLCNISGKKVVYLLAPIAYFTLMHCVFIGSVRYRIPIMPFIEGLAAYGICAWPKFFSRS